MAWAKEFCIPNPVIAVLGEAIGDRLSHTTIDTLFMESDFPGEPPAGNKVDKCQAWLKVANNSSDCAPLIRLGRLLGSFSARVPDDNERSAYLWNRINAAMAKAGLRFDGHDSVVRLDSEGAPRRDSAQARWVGPANTPTRPTPPPRSSSTSAVDIISQLFGPTPVRTARPADPIGRAHNTPRKKSRVFVVHGHQKALKNAVARFLHTLGCEPIILHEQEDKELTLIAKLQAHTKVDFAVVLLTGDDRLKSDDGRAVLRPRQNVVLELGYFAGLLGLDNVCAIAESGLDFPSDIAGVIYAPVEVWPQRLLDRLTTAGFVFEQAAMAKALRID